MPKMNTLNIPVEWHEDASNVQFGLPIRYTPTSYLQERPDIVLNAKDTLLALGPNQEALVLDGTANLLMIPVNCLRPTC